MDILRYTAFPKTKQGGNKAGVVPDAKGLDESSMQAIAAEVGYSETAFVLPSDDADFHVRFFTPTAEVDLCGHATIATFNAMRDLKMIAPGMYTQETRAGILRLDVRDDVVFMEQNRPVFYETLDPVDLQGCFAEPDVIDPSYPIQVVSTGMKEIFVPIRSVDVLEHLTPDFDAIRALSEAHGTIGMHVFALADDCDAYGRNFAPVVGIDEESATGTSNGALACYLNRYGTSKTTYVLRQGYAMGQPSEIVVTLAQKDGHLHAVWVGGGARLLAVDEQ
jgi:PhzF family phenazine biosynthesis protein